MPIVSAQITSQSGPTLDVFVAVSSLRHQALLSANSPVPNPLPVRALIDTGASMTCVDPSETNLASFGYEVLIGRDVLNKCLLVYNGPLAVFSLAQ